MRLLIGVPARNEADRIVPLMDRVELGASFLEGAFDGELALAYQDGHDDTLERFERRPARIPQIVLRAPTPTVGKGANVKLLLERARAIDADHLLLVDADLVDYDPWNLMRAVAAARRDDLDLVLPLWCRASGQGNTTNYLASPLLFAVYGARIRQPIAGHMLLGRAFLEQLDIDALPDDYGIDILLTLTALTTGAAIGQVGLQAPAHPSKEANSQRVMIEVATAVLGALGRLPRADRSEVTWPDGYWTGWEWPRTTGADVDLLDVVRRHAGSAAEVERLMARCDAAGDDVAGLWADHLAAAVRRVGAPDADLGRIVDDLVCPFFVHAAWRARGTTSVEELEHYVAALGSRLATRVR